VKSGVSRIGTYDELLYGITGRFWYCTYMLYFDLIKDIRKWKMRLDSSREGVEVGRVARRRVYSISFVP
jgi:hypothetical protein